MLRKVIESCENSRVGPGSWFLTFLAVAIIRLHGEVLYLDYRRTPEFFILNLGYFLSLILSISLMLKFVSGEYLPRVLRAGLPFSAVILVPLLDFFFYPHLRGDDLLDICGIPVFGGWLGYAIYFVREILSHTFFLSPRVALGLRLEVLAGGVAVLLYVVGKARSRWAGLLKGVFAYFLYLSLVYTHVVFVVHPALRAWIFPPLVLVELMFCLSLWKPGARAKFVSWITWPVVLFVASGLVIGYGLGLRTVPGPAGLGEMIAVACGLVALGIIGGANKTLAEASAVDDLARWTRNLAPVFCGLAVYPIHRYVFLSFMFLLGLLYLCWISPWQLARLRLVFSLIAGLVFWVSAWTGQVVLHSGPGPAGPGLSASMEGMRMPKGHPPSPGQSFPMPPPPHPDWKPGAGPGPFPGIGGPPAGMADHGPEGGRQPPFRGPPGLGDGPEARGNTPPPPFFGMPGSGTSGELPPLWPDWLYHPGWLVTPLVMYGLLCLRKR